QETLDETANARLARKKAVSDQDLTVVVAKTEDYVRRLKAQAQKEVEVSGAVQPGLVEAITALGQSGMLEKLAANVAPLAIVKGISIGGAIQQLFEGTPFEKTVGKLVQHVDGSNGEYKSRFETEHPEHDESRWEK
ncbi:hypothetical protein LCGC14_1670720, partial [marine sediment metagenome]